MSCPKCGPSRVMTTVCPKCKGPLHFGAAKDDNTTAHPIDDYSVIQQVPEQIVQQPSHHHKHEKK